MCRCYAVNSDLSSEWAMNIVNSWPACSLLLLSSPIHRQSPVDPAFLDDE